MMKTDARSDNSCLVIDLRPGESLGLDGSRIKVELLHKSGQIARLRVVAPRDVVIEKEATEPLQGRP